MEAPEKIYIHPDIGGREFLRPWLHRPANNESVEYTRTDLVIERACEWIEHNNKNGGCSFDGWRKEFIKFLEDEL